MDYLWNWRSALCVLGVVLSLGDDQTHAWDRAWDIVGPFVIAVVGIYYVYQLMKRLDRAEGEVRCLASLRPRKNSDSERRLGYGCGASAASITHRSLALSPSSGGGRMLQATSCALAHAVPTAAKKVQPSSAQAGLAIILGSIRSRLTNRSNVFRLARGLR